MTRILALSLIFALALSAASPAFGQADGQKVLDEWGKLVVGGMWTTTDANNAKWEHAFRWVVPGKLLQLDVRGGAAPSVEVIRVDAATKQCVWTSFNDDGTSASGILTQAPSGVFTLDSKGTSPQGENRYKGRIRRVDSDTVKEEIVEFVRNGQPQRTGTNTWKRIGQSTRKDFGEYCQAVQGRWVGEITWVADFPGFGKKGDSVTTYAHNQISEDGNALIGKFFGGSGASTGITWFDAEAKQIRWVSVASGGNFWEQLISKEGGRWVSRMITGSDADGTAYRGSSTLTISDDGTHTWTGTGTIGGTPNAPQKDVWRRVSKK